VLQKAEKREAPEAINLCHQSRRAERRVRSQVVVSRDTAYQSTAVLRPFAL